MSVVFLHCVPAAHGAMNCGPTTRLMLIAVGFVVLLVLNVIASLSSK